MTSVTWPWSRGALSCKVDPGVRAPNQEST